VQLSPAGSGGGGRAHEQWMQGSRHLDAQLLREHLKSKNTMMTLAPWNPTCSTHYVRISGHHPPVDIGYLNH
jgi:hypothetical protein